uniref:BFN domain-containing protein n=1 Tax=Fervidicoccus fontis TaxID=683846 RepID=A0A7J3ZKR7_9CREN
MGTRQNSWWFLLEEPFELDKKDYLRVIDIEAFVAPGTPGVPVIVLHLEGGLNLTLYHVPYEIVEAINNAKGIDLSISGVIGKDRESIFDILVFHDDLRNTLTSDLSYVVVDELDTETMLFTARAVFSNGNTRVERRMIPSHAVFLAYISDKPIYVKRDLAEGQSAFEEEEG